MLVAGVQIRDDVFAAAVAAADSAACPRGLVVGLIAIESDGDPSAGAGTCYVGLLQLGVCDASGQGWGSGYSAAQLATVGPNLAVGVPFIANAYHAYGNGLAGTDWWYVMQRSGHPGYPAGSVAYLWTQTARPDLGGLTAVQFVQAAVQQLDVAGGGGGTGAVAGIVTSANGQPVSGAVVTLAGQRTSTGSAGGYSLSGVAAGTYALTVQAAGIGTATVQVSVGAGALTTVNVVLAALGQPPPFEFVPAADWTPWLVGAALVAGAWAYRQHRRGALIVPQSWRMGR